jgi:hypothetical protein
MQLSLASFSFSFFFFLKDTDGHDNPKNDLTTCFVRFHNEASYFEGKRQKMDLRKQCAQKIYEPEEVIVGGT